MTQRDETGAREHLAQALSEFVETTFHEDPDEQLEECRAIVARLEPGEFDALCCLFEGRPAPDPEPERPWERAIPCDNNGRRDLDAVGNPVEHNAAAVVSVMVDDERMAPDCTCLCAECFEDALSDLLVLPVGLPRRIIIEDAG